MPYCCHEAPEASPGSQPFLVFCRKFKEWRDPDSNRGHHDFQSVYVCAALYRYFLAKGLNKANLYTFRSAQVRRVPPNIAHTVVKTVVNVGPEDTT